MQARRLSGCVRYRRLRRSAACGCNSTSTLRAQSAGEMRIALPRAARMISSPYDSEAHYARKRSASWIGYKAHLTETCDEERPNLITHVETTAAPIGDSDAVGPIHEALEKKDLLPSTHLVDAGYVEAKLLASATLVTR